MSGLYQPAYPTNHPVAQSIKDFISKFYATSDSPGLTDEWVGCFREDATVIMGDRVAEGKEEIRKLRVSMWKKVASRRHVVVKVFPASFERIADMRAAEFMVFGAVTYVLKKGEEEAADWAAHAKLKRDGGVGSPWRFEYYKVYIQA
ncbi:hypothetical protein B0T22DRAFT_435791 [Podospora appendiculata]|uniref:SnoaL-like domain-containing protein n=1 Tax=Podospora appendiculata TaxID=314037 RepID=A0AAE0XFX0_9PEZI|nr:hypothetical protein B0T22DRAFT_435791 [Podospora appendiculata]